MPWSRPRRPTPSLPWPSNAVRSGELYLKVDYTGRLLESFGGLPDAAGYIDMLGRTLEAGQINIVDYYSELDTFYSALETRIRTDLEYRLGLARLNVIYM